MDSKNFCVIFLLFQQSLLKMKLSTCGIKSQEAILAQNHKNSCTEKLLKFAETALTNSLILNKINTLENEAWAVKIIVAVSKNVVQHMYLVDISTSNYASL